MSDIIDNVLRDAQQLRAKLSQSNRLGSFERQLLSQLFVMNDNESVMEQWLTAMEAPLREARDELLKARDRITELEAEAGPALSPVDEITERRTGTAG